MDELEDAVKAAWKARLRTTDGFEGNIHKAGSHYYMNNAPCNGWDYLYLQENGHLITLGGVREKYRVEKGLYDKQPE